MSDIVPDVPSVFQGWRAFNLPLEDYGPPRLWSSTMRHRWEPRVASVAECSSCGDDGPKRACSCGLYSAKSYDHLQTMSYYRYDVVRRPGLVAVVAVVANWGRFVEGELGWRTRYSYPQMLFIPHAGWPLARRLAHEYRIPYRLVNTLKPRRR